MPANQLRQAMAEPAEVADWLIMVALTVVVTVTVVTGPLVARRLAVMVALAHWHRW